MTGIERIRAERVRQIEVEKFAPDDDFDKYKNGQLAKAGRAYELSGYPKNTKMPAEFPWAVTAWRPTDDMIRALLKAGALYLAESDRLETIKASQSDEINYATIDQGGRQICGTGRYGLAMIAAAFRAEADRVGKRMDRMIGVGEKSESVESETPPTALEPDYTVIESVFSGEKSIGLEFRLSPQKVRDIVLRWVLSRADPLKSCPTEKVSTQADGAFPAVSIRLVVEVAGDRL